MGNLEIIVVCVCVVVGLLALFGSIAGMYRSTSVMKASSSRRRRAASSSSSSRVAGALIARQGRRGPPSCNARGPGWH